MKLGTKTWQSLSCCQKLISVGALLLSSQWEAAKNYECTKVSGTEFKVLSLYKPSLKPNNVLNGDISKIKLNFYRVRTFHKTTINM